MPNQYVINIDNRSGAGQSYALFSQIPTVSGSVTGQIWPTVLDISNCPPEATAEFNITTQYYALLGNSQGTLQRGVRVNTSQTKPVELGSQSSDGQGIPGTSLKLVKGLSGALEFSREPESGRANTGAFAIKTGDFSVQDASNGNWAIGIGGTVNGRQPQPLAVFCPQPGVTYNIEPKKVFYVVPGQFSRGQVVDANSIGSSCVIDFERLSRGNATIVHDPRGILSIKN